jgi:hypothetical protein
MGFLSKKSMLVSLLALSLAACTSGPTTPNPRKAISIPLPCKEVPPAPPVEILIDTNPHTITFLADSGCALDDVKFKTHPEHFHRRSPPKPVIYDYDGLPIPSDGAYFDYGFTLSGGTDPNGGGVIRSY